MRKFLVGAFAMLMSIGANAQYQLTNSDFEEWESVSYSGRTGNEPVKWSSFLDGTGNLKSMAGYIQLEKSTDKPASSTGSYSAKLTSRAVKLFGATIAVAQGNLTNGCINMGSTTATDAKGNYNYINTGRDDQSMKFTGRPDAVSVWVKFSGTKTANVEVVLVTDGYYQSPNANDITAKEVAKAQNDAMASNDTWTEYVIPFAYTGEAEVPTYSLVNISTCAVPGGGKEADYMVVDDMKMIYYSELASVTYGGTSVSVASSMTVDASYDESKLVLTSNGHAATIEKSYDAATAVLTVTVKGDNISEDASNLHTYTIQFNKALPKYTVKFMDGETELMSFADITEGTATPKPETNPTKEGYTFTGWDPEVAANVTADATYTAKWKVNQYKITFVIDGATVKEEALDFGASVTAPEAPSREGYTFAGWTGTPATMPAGDVTVTGSYTINKYTVKFVDEDGTVYSSESVEFGSVITAPADPTKDGYDFVNWASFVEGATVPANDVTFTAVWEEKVNAIESVSVNGKYEIFTTSGNRVNTLQKGVNIIKMGNTVKKVIVK